MYLAGLKILTVIILSALLTFPVRAQTGFTEIFQQYDRLLTARQYTQALLMARVFVEAAAKMLERTAQEQPNPCGLSRIQLEAVLKQTLEQMQNARQHSRFMPQIDEEESVRLGKVRASGLLWYSHYTQLGQMSQIRIVTPEIAAIVKELKSGIFDVAIILEITALVSAWEACPK